MYKGHARNRDSILDEGGSNEVTAANLKILDDNITFDIALNNTIIGAGAGVSITSADLATLVGKGAGALVTIARRTTCFGYNAGANLDTGGGNTCIGAEAGEAVASNRQNNTLVGVRAGKNANFSGNVFVGMYAGQNATGGNSVVVGREAGEVIGVGCVCLGYKAGQNETGSNKLYIANSNTVTPLIYGEFGNNLLRINGTNNSLVAEDTDFDTDAVLNTGLGASYGILVVRELTGGIVASYRVDNETLTVISADATFSTTKDTGSKYNVYWETDQFKVQNKVGNDKDIRVGFFGLN